MGLVPSGSLTADSEAAVIILKRTGLRGPALVMANREERYRVPRLRHRKHPQTGMVAFSGDAQN